MELEHFDLTCATAITDRHLPDRGRPAPSLPFDGMPAYRSVDGRYLVMETLLPDAVAFDTLSVNAGWPRMIPASYAEVTARAPTDLVPLHDSPAAWWRWRPQLYTLSNIQTEWDGSQIELEWRQALAARLAERADEEDLAWQVAHDCVNRKIKGPEFIEICTAAILAHRKQQSEPAWLKATWKARALLTEHLEPQQRLEHAATRSFHVRGTLNQLYRIRVNNGFEIVDPYTLDTIVSACLHTDEWIPGEDNALAAKLLIDSGPEGEAELLAAAACHPPRRTRTSRPVDREAWAMHRQLLPAAREQ